MYTYFVLFQDQQHIAKLVETGKEDTPVTIPDDNGVAVSGGSKGRSKGRKREEHTPVGKWTLLMLVSELTLFGGFQLPVLYVYIYM